MKLDKRIHLDTLRQNWRDDLGVSLENAVQVEAYVNEKGVSLYAKGTITKYNERQEISLDKESALLLAKSILIMLEKI